MGTKRKVIDVEDEPLAWSCAACTLFNPPARCECEACGLPKGKTASLGWTCAACTLVNQSEAARCQACQQAREAPASVTLDSPLEAHRCHAPAPQTPAPTGDLELQSARLIGVGAFRPGQLEVIRALAAGQDVLYVFPTGAGKSLCFQVPALMSQGKFGLVISPLIALMKDQVRSMRAHGVPAVAIHSELSATERRDALAMIGQKRGEKLKGFFAKAPKLVYLSPELATSSSFAEILRGWSSQIALVAIDEAHCVSKWGHDFRPCYRCLHQLRNVLPQLPWAACTATATAKVRKDVAENLGLKGKPVLEVLLPFDRHNLRYGVISRRDREFGGDPYTEVVDLTASQPSSDCGIIYCQRQADCENIADLLQECGVPAMPFHAGLSKSRKQAAFDAFIGKAGAAKRESAPSEAKARVLVATIAFGMGVDKADIRFVFHASPPRSLSAYYQESGRAGRDGKPALCVMFYAERDFASARMLIQNRDRFGSGGNEIALQELEAVEEYCGSTSCRRRMLLNHFGDPNADAACGSRKPEHCCDRCAAGAKLALHGLPQPKGRKTSAMPAPADLPGLRPASKAFSGHSMGESGFVTARQLRGMTACPSSNAVCSPKKKKRLLHLLPAAKI